ncbi:MAG: response regulator [Anaerolineae bacterium]|nr:response regulator [Anaerolineae bacterium]
MSRVLIVDDAIDLGRLLQTSLTMLHPTPTSAVVPSAEEAILEAMREKVDLLVTDLRLPGMTGQELTERIRSRNPEAKVIMITGLTDDIVLQQAESQSDILLRKPMEIQDFLAAVRKCLNMDETSSAQAVIETEKPETRLPVRLADLRKRMNALTTLLLDHNGRVVAQAGDLPDMDFESKLGQLLVTAIGYGLKVSLLLGKTAPENVMAFHGETYHLVLAPVGDYVLVLAADAQRTGRHLSKVVDEVLVAQKEFSMILSEMESNLPSAVVTGENAIAVAVLEGAITENNREIVPANEVENNEPDEDLEKFEAIFTQPQKVPPEKTNADEFWDSAAASHRFGPGSASRLTFEQAHQLGLTPDE